MLDQLPLEILHMVAHAVNCSTDLSKLSRANKHLHQSLVPLLYETAVIKTNEEFLDQLELTPVKTWFRQDGSKTIFNTLEFAKHLKLVAPIEEKLQKRCYYGDVYIEHPRTPKHWTANLESHYFGMEDLVSNFQNLLFHLPEQSLRSFSWHLGCCVPSSILGIDGWLPSKHSEIRTLSLITDGTCYSQEPEEAGILKLTQIRSFSWKGFEEHDIHQHHMIRQCLALNSAHLESLELEPTVKVDGAVEIDQLLNIQSDFLDVELDGHTAPVAHPDECSLLAETSPTKLVVLRHLSLFNILLGSYEELMSAINLHQLQSLKLLVCVYGSNILSGMSSSGKRINLRSFEWVSGDILEIYRGVRHISEFLKSFEGLEELYLSTSPSALSLNDIISQHRATMKRLVFHMRGLNETEGLHGALRDTHGPMLEDFDNIFRLVPLECIGCHQSPSWLRHALGSNLAAKTVKLIHFRITAGDHHNLEPHYELYKRKNTCTASTADDLDPFKDCNLVTCMPCLGDFADWAFGPTGLPNLMVIAFGDFSFGDRFKWSQALLIRSLIPSTNLYRIVGHGMHDHMIDRISGSREMLSACPTQSTIVYSMNHEGSGIVTDFSAYDLEDSADGTDNSSEGDD